MLMHLRDAQLMALLSTRFPQKGLPQKLLDGCAKENDADLVGGINIDVEDDILKVLIDLSQDASMIQSNKLASKILKNLGTVNKLHKKVEQAGFVVLKAPDIPSVLIETAFLSNPKEEKNLNDATYQMKLAKAIVKGIKNLLMRLINNEFKIRP